jgi:hypothetical protein
MSDDHDFTWLKAFERNAQTQQSKAKVARECLGCRIAIVRNADNMGPSGSYCMNCLAERG